MWNVVKDEGSEGCRVIITRCSKGARVHLQ